MGVNFENASLKDTNFEGSYLFKTKFIHSKDLTESQLLRSLLCKTTLPENIDLDPDRDCQEIKKRLLQKGSPTEKN
jgi:uncharacterized protein YjbI with pentapeptide repeats